MISKVLANGIIDNADRLSLVNFTKDIIFDEIEAHPWDDERVNRMLEIITGSKGYTAQDIDPEKLEAEVKRSYKGENATDINIIGVHTCTNSVNVTYKSEDSTYSNVITLSNVLK